MRQPQRAPPDEGYSEENGSSLSDIDMTAAAYDEDDDDNDHAEDPGDVPALLKRIFALPVGKRADLAHALIPTLPNPDKEELKRLINDLTHFDPTLYLPAELVLTIFSYLSPADLLSASRISRAWRAKARDEKLWRLCFAREGWVLDRGKVEGFERWAEKKGKRVAEVLLRSPGLAGVGVEMGMVERRGSRKRGRDEAFSEGEAAGVSSNSGGVAGEERGVVQQQEIVEERNEDMEGVETTSITDSPEDDATRVGESPVNTAADQSTTIDARNVVPDRPTTPTSPADFKVAPHIFQSTRETKLSWPYLYKQRRRLESNWETGTYTMFSLPHPAHPEEGHSECVYTIQHTPRHLVSGSRDRTIRIWDLATNRLKSPPLRGHEASVLCLQFDERPGQDIIVSGGSDAFVIVWRFSTGELLKKMTRAHEESVLNLRFDDRYIVTCSKDKTIKIWNRFALGRDSPLIPTHVLQNFSSLGMELGAGEMIEEYTLLTTLPGHQAAVNAVMIHGSTIVSASGDRTIKSWDLSTGEFKKNYVGHTKGIACVQFDGRRIVSGSSDNTVRIFDAEQQAEIACLVGHNNLVRTVQARFGDLSTTTSEELAEEARQADMGFFNALASGMEPANAGRRGPGRNAGSSRPEDMLAFGTRVPPGGGGGRWAKIVSGSYDETVILWKRDREGKWTARHHLRQDELLRHGRSSRRRRDAVANDAQADPNAAAGAAGGNGGGAGGGGNAHGPPTLVQAQAHHHIATAQGHLVQATQLLHTHQGGQGHQLLPASQIVALASAQSHLGQQLGQQLLLQAGGPQQHPLQNNHAAQSVQQHLQQNAHQNTNNNAAAPAAQPVAAAAGNVAAGNVVVAAAAGGGGGGGGGHHRSGESNRVFKLQFDARRIVCCSQNKTIVGWDFANGDPELERVGEWSLETA